MISTQDRRDAVTLIDEAVKSGARLFRACAERALCTRTDRRWTVLAGTVKSDGRPMAVLPVLANALSEAERQKLVILSCQTELASLPPSQIVPILADRGEYYASESRFYRVLKAQNLQHHRGRSAAPSQREPRRHQANAPNQVWVMKFVRGYNTRHQHSALKFVTPEQRHQGADIAILLARKTRYEQAKTVKPERWRGATRNWDRPATVWLNPVRQESRSVKMAP